MKKLLSILLVLSCFISANAATGLIEFLGVFTNSAPANSPSTMAFDGDLANSFGTNQNGGWVGLYLGPGTNGTLTQWRFAPEPSSSTYGNGRELFLQGSQLYGAPGTPNNTTLIDTIPSTYIATNYPAFPVYERYSLYGRNVTNSTYSSFVMTPGSFPAVGELSFIGLAGGTAQCRPVVPTVTPAGYTCPSVVTPLITMTTPTTSASIYYTIDGTTPTTNSALYSAPFTMTLTGISNIVARAYDPTCTQPYSMVYSNEDYAAIFTPYPLAPGADWRSVGCVTSSIGVSVRGGGVLLQNHAGCLFDNRARDGWLYDYGEFDNYNESAPDIVTTQGIWAYRSKDGFNWTTIGEVLANTNSSGTPAGYIQRPKVFYNPLTSLYVLWAHSIYSATRGEWCYTSSVPTGPFNLSTKCLASWTPGDLTVFQDWTGTNYLVCGSNQPPSALWITPLDPTGTTNLPTPASTMLVTNGNREAPIVLYNAGTYYCINSFGNYYDSTSTYNVGYSVSTNGPMGPWNYVGLAFINDPLSLATKIGRAHV